VTQSTEPVDVRWAAPVTNKCSCGAWIVYVTDGDGRLVEECARRCWSRAVPIRRPGRKAARGLDELRSGPRLVTNRLRDVSGRRGISWLGVDDSISS
jgi:hypothetical protein